MLTSYFSLEYFLVCAFLPYFLSASFLVFPSGPICRKKTNPHKDLSASHKNAINLNTTKCGRSLLLYSGKGILKCSPKKIPTEEELF